MYGNYSEVSSAASSTAIDLSGCGFETLPKNGLFQVRIYPPPHPSPRALRPWRGRLRCARRSRREALSPKLSAVSFLLLGLGWHW